MIVTPVAKEPSALRKSRESKPSPEVLRTGAAWLPTSSSLEISFATAAPSERRVGRQSERHPAVDRAVDVPGQHIMGIGCVNVAECALDRVSFINRAAARRCEQQVDGSCAQGRRKGSVAPIARALLYAGHDPGLGDPGCLVAIPHHDRLCCI